MNPLGKLYGEYRGALRLFNREARLFLAGTFLVGVGSNLISLLFSLFLKRLGYTEAAIGQVLSLSALGSVIVAAPISFIAARLPSNRLLTAAAPLAAAAAVAQAFATGEWGMAAATFCSGAFGMVFTVIYGPFCMRNSGEKERIHLFAIYNALSFGTGVVGSLVAGLIKDSLSALSGSEFFGYRATILIGAAFILAAMRPFSRIRPREASSTELARADIPARACMPTSGSNRGFLVRAFRIGGRLDADTYVRVLLPSLLSGLGAGLMIPYLNLYFKKGYGMSDSAIGAVVAVGQVLTFLGLAASPTFARRLGRRWSIVLTQAISTPLIIVIAYAGSLPLVILAYLGRQSLMNLSGPLQDNFALELVPPDQQNLMTVLKNILWSLAWTISAWLAGAWIYARGFVPPFTATAILYASSTTLFWLFFLWPERKAKRYA